jgi:TPR repeat protein
MDLGSYTSTAKEAWNRTMYAPAQSTVNSLLLLTLHFNAQTKAFEYFLNATTLDEDADSWANAAHMLLNGLGVPANATRAAEFYRHGSTKYGHFGSTFELGKLYLEV